MLTHEQTNKLYFDIKEMLGNPKELGVSITYINDKQEKITQEML